MKKNIKKTAALLLAGAISLSTASLAFADSARLSGELNTSGSLVQYDYTRTHTFTGPITLSVDDMPSGYLRLGLRNMKIPGGPQFGPSIQWNDTGAKSWDDVLAGTRFAFQGRMEPCSWWCDQDWGGDLTY